MKEMGLSIAGEKKIESYLYLPHLMNEVTEIPTGWTKLFFSLPSATYAMWSSR